MTKKQTKIIIHVLEASTTVQTTVHSMWEMQYHTPRKFYRDFNFASTQKFSIIIYPNTNAMQKFSILINAVQKILFHKI